MPQYLADVAQWIECGLVDQMVTSSIPSWGTCLGCGPGPCYWAHERQPHIDVSLSLFPSLTLPLKINNIVFKKECHNKKIQGNVTRYQTIDD